MEVYFTSDNGNNWSTINSGLKDLNITGFAVYNGKLLCGTTLGIYFYDAETKTWNLIGKNLTEQGLPIYTLPKILFLCPFELKKEPFYVMFDNGKPVLAWHSFPEVKISGFELFRKEVNAKNWNLIKKFSASELTFSDDTAKPGTAYLYVLKSFDSLNPRTVSCQMW